MLKIGQNRGKIANYPPNAQQRSASLLSTSTVNLRAYGRFLAIDTCSKLHFYIELVCNTPTYNFTSTAKAGWVVSFLSKVT